MGAKAAGTSPRKFKLLDEGYLGGCMFGKALMRDQESEDRTDGTTLEPIHII